MIFQGWSNRSYPSIWSSLPNLGKHIRSTYPRMDANYFFSLRVFNCPSNCSPGMMHDHIGCLFNFWMVTLLSVIPFSPVLLSCLIYLFFLHCVSFQMSPQMACLRGGIVTLVAFVKLFSTVPFHMCPQRTWMGACKVTLFAFLWLFATVCFQIHTHIACLRGCIITLVAFV